MEPETVAKWGRQSERLRYLVEDSVCAREHALRDDPLDRRDSDISYHDAAAARTDDTELLAIFCLRD